MIAARLKNDVEVGVAFGTNEHHRRNDREDVMLERQRQARLRRAPPPRRPVVTAPSPAVRAVRSEVRSLDLDTKVAMDSLRGQLNQAAD